MTKAQHTTELLEALKHAQQAIRRATDHIKRMEGYTGSCSSSEDFADMHCIDALNIMNRALAKAEGCKEPTPLSMDKPKRAAIAETFEHVGYSAETGQAIQNKKAGTPYDKRPAEANARLIAAAPDMYKELKRALHYLEMAIPAFDEGGRHRDYVTAGGMKNTLLGIKAIIAKSEGK